MRILTRRLVGLASAALGVGLIVFIMEANYRTSVEWDRILFSVGMPLSFLSTAVGALLVAVGVLIFAHARGDAGPSR
jgi:hypothetical protein